MKIKIKFDRDDASEITKAELVGACGTVDELAATLFTIVTLTDHHIGAVLAELLGYTDPMPALDAAIKRYPIKKE